MGNVTISTAIVPEGTCPSWIIALWPNLVQLLSANLNGADNVFNYGNSVPAPADQDKPWIRLNADGTPDKLYVYSGGSWISPHPIFTGAIWMWEGDITTINTLDGGDTLAPTTTTGPMWEHVTELAAKFPIGVGTLPSGTILAVGSTGGEETHLLVTSELPAHQHFVENDSVGSGAVTTGNSVADRSPNTGNAYDLLGAVDAANIGRSASVGSDMAHNNLPPYYALHAIRRTGRLFYRQ